MNYYQITILLFILFLIVYYAYTLVVRFLLAIFPSINVKLRLISFLVASIPLIMLLSRTFSSLLIFIFYILLFSIIFDIIHLFIKRYKHKVWKIVHSFLIFPIFISSVLTIYGYYNAHNVQKTTYSIKSSKNIQNDYKIALISDLHFGNSFDLNKLKEQVAIISKDSPDLVILAGDIVDEQTPIESYDEVFSILSTIQNKYGIYYVLGNHDENRYINHVDNRNLKLKNAIETSNITILNDESELVNDDIIVSGRIDYSYERNGKRISAENLASNLDDNKFLIVADHQPSQYIENKEAGFDLQVSGHTHAGQVWPFGIVTSLIGFDYGLLQEDNFNLVVSSGMGLWGMPVRTEESSEYVIINIKKD